MDKYINQARTANYAYTLSEIGQDYGISAQVLTKLLLKANFLQTTKNSYYKYTADKKYCTDFTFSINDQKYTNNTKNKLIRHTLKFNNNGIEEIYNILNNYNIKPVVDYIDDTEINIHKQPTPNDLIVLKRNYKHMSAIYICYYKNLSETDYFGRNCQLLNTIKTEEIKELMKDSYLSNRDGIKRGPRISNLKEDIDNFNKIDKIMEDYFNLFIDKDNLTKKYSKINNKQAKKILAG